MATAADDVRAAGPWYGNRGAANSNRALNDLAVQIRSAPFQFGPQFADQLLIEVPQSTPVTKRDPAPPVKVVTSPAPPPGSAADVRVTPNQQPAALPPVPDPVPTVTAPPPPPPPVPETVVVNPFAAVDETAAEGEGAAGDIADALDDFLANSEWVPGSVLDLLRVDRGNVVLPKLPRMPTNSSQQQAQRTAEEAAAIRAERQRREAAAKAEREAAAAEKARQDAANSAAADLIEQAEIDANPELRRLVELRNRAMASAARANNTSGKNYYTGRAASIADEIARVRNRVINPPINEIPAPPVPAAPAGGGEGQPPAGGPVAPPGAPPAAPPPPTVESEPLLDLRPLLDLFKVNTAPEPLPNVTGSPLAPPLPEPDNEGTGIDLVPLVELLLVDEPEIAISTTELVSTSDTPPGDEGPGGPGGDGDGPGGDWPGTGGPKLPPWLQPYLVFFRTPPGGEPLAEWLRANWAWLLLLGGAIVLSTEQR